VVQTYDVGMLNGAAYIAMEYVRGPDVKRVLHALRKEKRMMPVDVALRIVADTAAGLHYAHSYVDPAGTPHPMVHRDVSPHNILVSLDGVIKLSDFGIAKVAGEGDDSTRAGTFKGKIHYVSPEAVALQPLDGRNDVFGLGVTLFEMVTGRLPFKRDSEAASLHAIVYDAAPDPVSFNPEIPREVANLILRALEKDPNRRTPSAGQMRDEIEAVMANLAMTTTSAARVAQFIQGLFTEFGISGSMVAPSLPSVSGSAPGPHSNHSNRPRTNSNSNSSSRPNPPAGSGSGSGGSRPPGPAPDLSAQPVPKTAVERPPRPPPLPAMELEVDVPAPEQGATALVRPSGLKAAMGAAPSAPSNPSAARLAPAPSAPPLPRRAQPAAAPQLAPAPAPAQPARPPAPTLARVPAAPPSPAKTAPAPGVTPARVASKRSPMVIALAGTALVAVAALVVALGKGGADRVQVVNLGSDETLFVAGRRIAPADLLSHGSAPQVVAVARGGKLIRLGNSPVQRRLDAQSLVAVPEGFDDRPESMGQVSVTTDPPGCFVTLEGDREALRSPATLKIPPGLQRRVEISCSGRPLYVEDVLAIPGQLISLDVAPRAQ